MKEYYWNKKIKQAEFYLNHQDIKPLAKEQMNWLTIQINYFWQKELGFP